MNDRDYPGEEAACHGDDHTEPAATDPVDAAVASYLDFLEGLATRPALDQLPDDDRRRAVAVINSLLAGRGIELNGSTPSVETLLAGTELESLLEPPNPVSSDRGQGSGGDREAALAPAARPIDRERARVERIENALRGADSRVLVRAEPHKLLGPAVTVAYLDLQVVFFPVDAPSPVITGHTRGVLSRLLSDDTNLDYVGVVADDSNDLLTQLLSVSDLGLSAVTPSDDLQLPWPPVLPLPLALRAMLELAAPSWEPFIFDTSRREPLQIADVASDATRRVFAREISRPYRGDKGRAYKSFAGSETTFTDLIVRLAAAGTTDVAVADALDRIARDAA
jgi:hypothetical protein